MTLIAYDCCSAKIQPLTNWYRNHRCSERSSCRTRSEAPRILNRGSSNEWTGAVLVEAQVISKRKNRVQRVQRDRGLWRTKRRVMGGTGGRNRNWNNRGVERRDRVQFTGQSLSYYRYRIATRTSTAAFPPPSWTNVCTALPWTDSGAKQR